MFIGVKPLFIDLPTIFFRPSRLFWTVFGKPRHEPARSVMGGLFAPVVILAEQNTSAWIIDGRVAVSVQNVVGFQRPGAIAVIDGTTAGGVDLLAPCGCGGHITPSTPITPGIAAIPLFCLRARASSKLFDSITHIGIPPEWLARNVTSSTICIAGTS